VATIRIMTYNIHGYRGSDGRADPERVLEVIAEGAADVVVLQETAASGPDPLPSLAGRLGLRAYGHPGCGNAFLSYFPLRAVQTCDLGGGCCLRADLDVADRRLHLLNLRLDPHGRSGQLGTLLGPELLGGRTLACPAMVLGDFADLGGGLLNVPFGGRLQRARRPLWRGTYPARCPLVGRDRAYLCGELRVLESSILRSAAARRASTHLPLILTVQICDPRTYLKVEQTLRQGRMEIAPG
jgi:endonuclease/exonuclease/phosphatase family metal-dependent hydrolase